MNATSASLNSSLKVQILANLDSVPSSLIVVNKENRIVMVNQKAAGMLGGKPEQYQGLSCGEVLRCVASLTHEEGCGTTTYCRTCGILSSLKAAFKGQHALQQEQQLQIGVGAAQREMRLLVAASPFDVGGHRFALLSLEDVTEQVRIRHQR